MRMGVFILCAAVTGCGGAGGPKMGIETIRPVGLLGSSHAVTMVSNDASTVVSPVILADDKGDLGKHYSNFCSALSPEGVEAAAAASAASGSLDVAVPEVGQIGGSGAYKQANTRLVLPRPWNKTQGAVIFESYRFALCEAWRNNMLDDEEVSYVGLLDSAYRLALASADKEVATPGWQERNKNVTINYTLPAAPTVDVEQAAHGTFNNNLITSLPKTTAPASAAPETKAPAASQ